MENVVTNNNFWKNKQVLLTGHTGFKGSWLSLWLQLLGAKVIGFSLPPATTPNLFTIANVEDQMTHIVGDIRDFALLKKVIEQYKLEIIFHLAAQSLVRVSYREPLETYSTNVMGTVNVLEASRLADCVRVIVNVTSDKCYENKGWFWGYRENDRLGGFDPYSNSKACSELVTNSYQNVFSHSQQKIKLASARAGNVIGGGDWSEDRLIPDIMRAHSEKTPLYLRYPQATRPWQHVLEPLGGYLLLAEKNYNEFSNLFAESWNFGPTESGVKTVSWIVHHFKKLLDNDIQIIENPELLHEAPFLKLDCAKAISKLSWQPRWGLERCLQETANWYIAHQNAMDMRQFTINQIKQFISESDSK